MSNTHKLLRFARSACMSAGMFTLVVAGWQRTWAQEISSMTGQGAVIKQVDFHSAALSQGSAVVVQLLVGVLLLFAGFGLHALMVVRKDRTVHVHAARNKKNNKMDQLNVYWMNMRV